MGFLALSLYVAPSLIICHPAAGHEFLSQQVYLLRVVWFQLGGDQINALEYFMGSNNLLMIHACTKHLYRLDHLKGESPQSKLI